jgi:cell division septation protein DedD
MLGNTDDDVTLRSRRAEDRRGSDLHETPADREVTLNTGIVLALFFALALICATFFGFGYSMGHKSGLSAAASTASIETAGSATAVENTAVTKPTPGQSAPQPVPGYEPSSDLNDTPAKPAIKPAAPAASTPSSTTDATIARKPAVVAEPGQGTGTKPAPIVRTAAQDVPITSYNSATPTAGMTYVQIAAVSHQEDASVLLSALQRRGYKVLARSDVNDKLIHVQIGPFTDRKQAEATRQKLLGDGYNAFLK